MKNGKIDPLRFMVANYGERVTDACYVELGETTIYFSGKQLIALISRDTLYRTDEIETGIIYKRLRSATLRQRPKRVHQVKREDLIALVEEAIMTMASKLVDNKLSPPRT